MRGSAARLGLLFLALAALGGFAWYLVGQRDTGERPSFESQIQGMESWWASTRRTAAAGLAQFTHKKAEAVPALVKALDDGDEEVRRNALASLQAFGSAAKPSIPKLLDLSNRDPSPAVRREALAVLAGLKAAEAGPLLITALGDPDPRTRAEAARGLGLLGSKEATPEAIEALVGLLASSQADSVRIAAVEALQAAAHDKEEVNRQLVEVVLASDPSAAVRAQVMAGLRTATYKDRVAAIIEGLDDSSPQVRLMAGGHLARIGVDDDRAIPALCQAAAKADEATDEGMAANLEQVTLQPIDSKPDDETLARRFSAVARELKAVVESKRGVSRGAALNLLSRIIATYKKTPKSYLAGPVKLGVETILERVADETEDMPFRLQAINQWTTIVAGASAAEPNETLQPSAVWLVRLAELLKSPAEPIRARAGEILVDASSKNLPDVSIRGVWKRTVPLLVEALKSDDPKTAAAALSVLQNLGPEAAASLDAVRALAAADHGPLAPAAGQAVKRIGALEDLKSKDPAVRIAAAEILGDLAWRSAPALPSLIEALKDADPKVRRAVAAALGKLGGEAGSALDPLKAQFHSETVAQVKAAALGALDRIAPQDQATIDAHLDALRDADSGVRLAGATFPNPPPTDAVVQALATALGDKTLEVGKAAAAGLVQLVGASPLVIPILFQTLGGEEDARRPIVRDALYAHIAEVTGAADYGRSLRDDRAAKRPADTTFRAIVAASLPPLDKALKSHDSDVRLLAAVFLGRLVAASRITRDASTRKALEPGLEALLATLGGDDSDVQTDVLERLKEVRLQPEAIVASLLKLLEKPGGGASMEVRGEVFDVLVELAQDARANPGALEALEDAEPVMIAVLGDQDAEVRAGAARVLAAIGAAKAKAETPK
ncbi:HEAT repeat domain-containing protein [Paludisphaera borealis]|uniref:Uncharacterized protein n=1 Tax=Paludisphaera borealis TaxID=1387353 RepID=A0A1U7CRA2_9BACT|nr:HEAT repeat domain-containing protein [Paludisphaera borealis]APW61461.1 hypothetical protein BSF38_02975 [Paludisphaera borealis]